MTESAYRKWLQAGQSDAAGLQDLCAQAAAVRDAAWGKCLTYSRKVFVPLTTMCRDVCGYCTFAQAPGSPQARIMTPGEVLEVTRNGQRMGCKEALFSLGEKPELRHPQAQEWLQAQGYRRMTEYLRDICALVLSESSLIPHVNAGTLSDEEIQQLKPLSGSMGMMLESLSPRLMGKGGPHHRCPDKAPKLRLQTLEAAGRNAVPFTTGLLIGIGESWSERVDALLAINAMHKKYGHIQEVIVQNFRAKPGTAMANHPEPDHRQMLLTLAVARLILDPQISLQAPPNLHDQYGDYIAAGINDWGGISPLTIDHINPERAWPQIEKLRETTRLCGYQLQERLTTYPRFLKQAQQFIDSNMCKPIFNLAGNDGLALVQVPT